MKNKLFSAGLWAEGMRKLRVFGFIGLAAILLADVAPVIASYMYRKTLTGRSPEVCGFTEMCSSVPFIAVVFSAVMMFILFSGFNKRAYCDFYHSLPYTRLCIFISFMASVMTWIVGISLISIAVSILTRLAMPWAFALSFAGFWRYCLCYLSVSILICGASASAMSVTGTLLSNIAVSGIILFFPRFITYIASSQIASGLAFMGGTDKMSLLSPRINLFIGVLVNSLGIVQYDLTYTVSIIYTFAVGVFYLIAAAVLFTKRKSEIAGQSAPGRKTQAVIRIVLSMVPSAVGTCSFISGDTESGIIFWIIAIIVYFAWEILSTLKWKNLLRAAPCFAAVIVINVIMALGIAGMSHMSASYRPEPEAVDSVRIIDTADNYISSRTAKLEITDREIITILSDTFKDNMERYYNNEPFYSYMNDGGYLFKNVAFREGIITRYRRLVIKEEDYKRIVAILEENESFTNSIMKLPEPVEGSLSFGYGMDLSAESIEKILERFQTEIYERGFETWFTAFEDIAYEDSKYGLEKTAYEEDEGIWMSYETDDIERQQVSVIISKNNYPKTYELIQRLSWQDASDSGAVDDIIKALKAVSENDGENFKEFMSRVEIGVKAQILGGRYYKGLLAYYREAPNGTAAFYTEDGETEAKADAEVLADFFEAVASADDAEPNMHEYVFVNASVNNGENVFSTAFYAPVPDDYIYTANGFSTQQEVFE